jgi:hypothetical protein
MKSLLHLFHRGPAPFNFEEQRSGFNWGGEFSFPALSHHRNFTASQHPGAPSFTSFASSL